LSSTVVCFGYDALVCKAQINSAISSSLLWIVIVASVSTVEIVIPFEPLDEFEIVLVLGFAEFFDFNVSFDANLLKSGL
jgi:hypothetical protein